MVLEDINLPIICIVRDSKIEKMARSDFEIRGLDKNYKLVAVERPASEMKSYTAMQIMITQQRSSYVMWKTP